MTIDIKKGDILKVIKPSTVPIYIEQLLGYYSSIFYPVGTYLEVKDTDLSEFHYNTSSTVIIIVTVTPIIEDTVYESAQDLRFSCYNLKERLARNDFIKVENYGD